MPDYIPTRLEDFGTWLSTLVTYTSANQALIGLTVGEAAGAVAVQTEFETRFAAKEAAQVAASAAADALRVAREGAEAYIRPMVELMQGKDTVTDEMREAMRIPVRDRIPTALDPNHVLLTAPPILLVEQIVPGQVLLKHGTNPANARANARPFGMRGVMIWYAVGGIPTEDAAAGPWTFVALDSESPYVHIPGLAEVTKLAYRAQWQDTLGRLGPTCDPFVVGFTPA